MDQKIELFAIVELFGHQKIAGVITEQVIAGASMVRVDVPDTVLTPGFSRFLNPSAIYAINPVTEEFMKAAAEGISAKPIQQYDAREMLRRIEMNKLPEISDDELNDEREILGSPDLPW